MAKNAVGENRKYWGVLPVMHAHMLAEIAKQGEQSGLEGMFAPQVYGPPFLPLAAATPVTERIKLATGIAIAAVRSPTETALAAIDMDRLSNGRFILGLGTSVSSWTSGIFGTPPIKPLSHLEETVSAIRHIMAGAHDHLEPFKGTWFSADFQEMSKIEPPVRDRIPIWIAALREKLVRLAVDKGDGVMGHPMWSIDWTVNTIGPVITDALRNSGKARTDIEVNIWLWAAPNPDEKAALDDARPTVAFYAGVEQYEPFFEAHGFGAEARACQVGVKQGGDYLSVVDKVPDDMVRTFVAIGDLDKVRETIEPIWGVADSVCIVQPAYALEPEKQMYYMGQIAQLNQG